jgi:acetylornithine deacetylase
MPHHQLDSTTSLLNRLIAFPTISTDSNIDLIQFAADRLDSLGAEVHVSLDGTGHKANMFATLGPKRDGGIVLSGHSDVVPVENQDWTSDPFIMAERDGRLFGRGTCDMKGFIAASLAMAEDYAALDLARPVHFCFTHDEETGCLGARALMEELKHIGMKPSACIIGEPTLMRIIEGHKGCYEYTTEFSGLAGHGSVPDGICRALRFAADVAQARTGQALPGRITLRAALHHAADRPHQWRHRAQCDCRHLRGRLGNASGADLGRRLREGQPARLRGG